ncbi:restriction endonuclease subunit S [Escherichia coli]
MGGIAITEKRKCGKVTTLPNQIINDCEQGEFSLGDLFEVLSSKKIFHANQINIEERQIEGSLPYVVRSTVNNGVRGYIVEDEQYANDGGTLSFAQDTFSVFWQKQRYFTGNKVKVLKPKFQNSSERVMIFLAACFQKVLANMSWGMGSTIDSISVIKIKLPVKNNEIDWNFMDNYIEELEAAHIEELGAYLLVSGLAD